MLFALAATAAAQPAVEEEPAPTAPEDQSAQTVADQEPSAFESLSAREAVREGNRLLIEGDPAKALQAYDHAERLRPEAPEIPFVQGLARFGLGEFEQSRRSFEKAAEAKDDRLAEDAEYGIGTTYHAEALASIDNPQLAISNFESAMQHYQNVLAARPDHEAAREANLKAGTMWRQLKQLMEKQQQPPSECENDDQKDQQEQQEQDQQQQQDNKDQKEEEKQQEQQSQKDQQQQEQENQDQQQQQQEEQQEQQQQQESATEEQEEDLREQAQRQLREMMQALRERKKARQDQEQQPVIVVPVDKDW